MSMTSLAPELLSILACPEDKGPLYYFEDLDALVQPAAAAGVPRP